MNEPGMIEPGSPSTATSRMIRLWTPRNIFWLGIFLGWPTALVLAIINWFRMGLWKKALIFTGGGLVALVLFFIASYNLPEQASRFPLLVLNILFLASFQALMNIDFVALGYPNANYKPASIGLGILVGILTLLVIFGGLFLCLFVVEMAKIYMIPAPIIPLPGREGFKEMHMAALALIAQ